MDKGSELGTTELEKFLTAQEQVYGRVVRELRNGRKESHWMWFIFPQLEGLGTSDMARRYAIGSLDEAREFLEHPVLGERLVECAEILLAIKTSCASKVFGYPDDMKLRSSMTLFSLASTPGSAFDKVLEKFFGGERDARTIELIGRGRSG